MKKKSVKKEEKCGIEKHCCHGPSPFVAIPASLGGILMVIVALVLIFAPEAALIIVSIAWSFVVLGFFALLFVYKMHVLMLKKK